MWPASALYSFGTFARQYFQLNLSLLLPLEIAPQSGIRSSPVFSSLKVENVPDDGPYDLSRIERKTRQRSFATCR
jgi:hypothetical protein